MDECAGMLSENVVISSSVFSILPCLRTLPKMSMVANSEYLLWRSSPTNMRPESSSRLIRFPLTCDYIYRRCLHQCLNNCPPKHKPARPLANSSFVHLPINYMHRV